MIRKIKTASSTRFAFHSEIEIGQVSARTVHELIDTIIIPSVGGLRRSNFVRSWQKRTTLRATILEIESEK